MSLAGDADWIIGVDTHLDTHTAAICDARGRVVAQLQVPATAAGYAQLLAWARSAAVGSRAVWAMEGTRHYGLGLARHLVSQGEQVSEIDNTKRVGKRRAGKSDAIGAVRAARELLARPHPAQMRADGDREALRLLMIDRDNAVASCKTARTALPTGWYSVGQAAQRWDGTGAPGGEDSVVDLFTGPRSVEAWAIAAPTKESLAAYTRATIRAAHAAHPCPAAPQTNQAITIGSAPARLLGMQCPAGSGFLVETAVTIRHGTAYVFASQNPTGTTPTDRAAFRKFLAGITFPR